jgi:hypothetical protein
MTQFQYKSIRLTIAAWGLLIMAMVSTNPWAVVALGVGALVSFAAIWIVEKEMK